MTVDGFDVIAENKEEERNNKNNNNNNITRKEH